MKQTEKDELRKLLRQAQWFIGRNTPMWWAIERALEPSKDT